MEKELLVSIDLSGTPHFVGRLWIHERRGRERASFEYSKEWRSLPSAFSLEPALSLGAGKFHTDKALFGSVGDSAPDRWGRMLMNRFEAREAHRKNRKARRLKESDYLLMVDDRTRQGALRFSTSPDGSFLTSYESFPIPPLVDLEKLVSRATKIENQDDLPSGEDLRDMFAPGSSLGGARPKAVVVDQNKNLFIAKFPSPKDEWDVELWEYVALKMAKRVWIPVPDFELQNISGQHVLLLKRFDRDGADIRIPFLSAMSMLSANDGDRRSYLDIAEALIEHGASTRKDLENLWRRLVFNILVSNLDDHLRNHGFLYDQEHMGWRLSPIYDLEPLPEQVKGRYLQTCIDLENNSASLDLAFEVAEEFSLTQSEARKIAKEVGESTKNWRREAEQAGAGKKEIDFMSSAFEHENLSLALRGHTKIFQNLP